MENYIIHKSASRGVADLGWLKSRHTFSFGHYYDPDRIHFGALRVLNDDAVSGGQGFGKHPHDNMEIVSIPLEGELMHKDSMGNEAIIREGEIQVMSAGTGIYHSEYNHEADKYVKFLQIWIIPNKRDVAPRYDQQKIDTSVKNVFHQVLSPDKNDEGVWIHQNAWFSIGDFTEPTNATYHLHDQANGVYAFVLNGTANINTHHLETRDGMGITGATTLNITANEGSRILLMEVPMSV